MRAEWLRRPTAETSVVFVHGILSSGEACWQHANGAYWPKLLSLEPDLKQLGIYVFTYQTGIFSGTYRLSDTVDALKEHMRLDEVLGSQKIVFVCHSMGGLVVRKFIVERAIELIDAMKEIGLFLVSSPSLGSSYADWFSPLAQVFGHAQADALRFVRNNDWVKDLDKEFTNLKEAGRLSLNGKELIEDKFVCIEKLFRRQVVEPFAGAKYFGEPFKVPESDHFSIAKPNGRDAIQHRLLVQFTKMMLSSQRLEPRRDSVVLAPHMIDKRSANSDPHSIPAPIGATILAHDIHSHDVASGLSDINTEKLKQLATGDPLLTSLAIVYFKNKSDAAKQLFDVPGNDVTQAAIRTILSSYGEVSANIILRRIRECGVSGDTWHQAQVASELASPALRDLLEKDLVALIKSGSVEVSRHAIRALGEIGAVICYECEVMNTDRDKCWSYAIDAAKRAFEIALDSHEIRLGADLLVSLGGIHPERWSGSRVHRMPQCDARHVDAITTKLLASQNSEVVLLGLDLLGEICISRSVPFVQTLCQCRDERIQQSAAVTIWRSRDQGAIAEMRRTSPAFALHGVQYGLDAVSDDSEFDMLLPVALQADECMAVRSIGLRNRRERESLVRDALNSPEPMCRGCAALSLARMGVSAKLERAHSEASDARERTFTALSLVVTNPNSFVQVENQLRLDLAEISWHYYGELQWDILAVLSSCPNLGARALAKAWAPFYVFRARRALSEWAA
jgi:pimeloyl-ACP methyl ester carboxylesterase